MFYTPCYVLGGDKLKLGLHLVCKTNTDSEQQRSYLRHLYITVCRLAVVLMPPMCCYALVAGI